MVTDLPDYEKKVVVVTVPGVYPALMEIDVVKVDGVAIATPTVIGCLPVSIEHMVKIDHRQILGEAFKTPTFANCVPTSIENEAIAYNAVTKRFKVDVEKWSATDIVAVSATALDIRPLTLADVVTVKSITDALPAGSNAIGKLAANSGVDIGDVDVLSLPATVIAGMTSLPAGVNAIGKLAANSGVDIGDVDVATMPSVAQATRTNLKAQVEREDLSLKSQDITVGTATVLNAVSGQSHKVYGWDYEADTDGANEFSCTFGGSTYKFARRVTKGVHAMTLVHPIVCDVNTALSFISAGNTKLSLRYKTET